MAKSSVFSFLFGCILTFFMVILGYGQTTYKVTVNYSCSNFVSGTGIALVVESQGGSQFKFYIVKWRESVPLIGAKVYRFSGG